MPSVPIFILVSLLGALGLVLGDTEKSPKLAPVLFLPGYGGSELYATISSSAKLPTTCQTVPMPRDRPFKVLDNDTMTSNYIDCVYSLLTLDFDPKTLTYSPAGMTGEDIEVGFFGYFKGLANNYQSFSNVLTSWGYRLYENAFAIPYDYRYISDQGMTAIGFTTRLKRFIEEVYERNQNQRVILIGHSNGGPTIYTFVTSSILSQEWKDKYIGAIITLSGNMLGQLNMIEPFVYAHNTLQQEMTCSWEGTVGSLAWGGYDKVKDLPIVTTNNANGDRREYTTKLNDLVDLFDSVNHSSWSNRLKALYGVHPIDGSALPTAPMDRSAHPMVDSYCLYGSNVSTSYSFIFDENIESTKAPKVLWMEGDDNQDIYDNEFCMVWPLDPRNKRADGTSKYFFEADAFPNVHHMEMYTNDVVLSKVKDILDKYSKK